MSHNKFKRLPKSLLRSKRPRQVYEQIAQQVIDLGEDRSSNPDLEILASLPVPAQTVYWVWKFSSEAGICGMDVFVLQHLGIYSPQIHAALKEVGAHELARLLEAAIPLARHAEFKQLRDQSWFKQFRPTNKFSKIAQLNEPTFALERGLDALVMAYIHAHEDVLLDD